MIAVAMSALARHIHEINRYRFAEHFGRRVTLIVIGAVMAPMFVVLAWPFYREEVFGFPVFRFPHWPSASLLLGYSGFALAVGCLAFLITASSQLDPSPIQLRFVQLSSSLVIAPAGPLLGMYYLDVPSLLVFLTSVAATLAAATLSAGTYAYGVMCIPGRFRG